MAGLLGRAGSSGRPPVYDRPVERGAPKFRAQCRARARGQEAGAVSLSTSPARSAAKGSAGAPGSTPSRIHPDRREHRLDAVLQRERRRHEPVEQRVRALRPALELGVELAGHEPRVVAQLDDLDQAAIGRHARQEHARALEGLAVAVVHLEPVAVTLVDDLLAVDRARLRARQQLGRVQAQAHRAALVLEVALVGHEVDDRVRREHVELGRVDVVRLQDLARELDDRALQAEAQAEVRDPVVAREVRREDLALDAPMAEAAGHEDRRPRRRAARARFSLVSASLSTQRTFASTPCAHAACLRDSVTER